MLIAKIEGHHRICGQSQDYNGLPIRDMLYPDGTPVMVTAWTPTPDELKALNEGANVIVCILGKTPPPMLVQTGIMEGLTDAPRIQQMVKCRCGEEYRIDQFHRCKLKGT